jgi:microcompartment protein CcmL/EutN
MLLAPPPYGYALGLLEVRSIARGIVVCDAMVKKAEVRLLRTEPVSPGKYVILFDGAEADADEAFRAGREVAKDSLVDSLFLSDPDSQVWQALANALPKPPLDSVGVIETLSIASTISAADAAVKGADVTLFQMQLAKGIGGKGWFALTGPLHMVEAAIEAATRAVPDGLLAGVEIVAAPHGDLGGTAL